MAGGLVIRLRPHESFIINGAVLENGDRRAKLRVKSPNAKILRMRDALHPMEATTPVKRLYYTAQLIVTGDMQSEPALPEILSGLKDLHEALPDPECRKFIEQAETHLHAGEYYQVLKALKQLIPFEQALLLMAHAREAALSNEHAG